MIQTARFLSPDTIIQAPSMTQNHNRYTYVVNNPMKQTDPIGHIFGKIVGALRLIGSLFR
ncbi:MAG: hypothetical protein JXR18_05830 [Neptuniibacter sp.]